MSENTKRGSYGPVLRVESICSCPRHRLMVAADDPERPWIVRHHPRETMRLGDATKLFQRATGQEPLEYLAVQLNPWEISAADDCGKLAAGCPLAGSDPQAFRVALRDLGGVLPNEHHFVQQ